MTAPRAAVGRRLAVFLAAFGLFASGCAASGDDQPGRDPAVGEAAESLGDEPGGVPDAEVEVIELWYQPNGGDPELIMQEELDRFHEQHPGIRVEPRMIGWDEALTRLATAIRSGEHPDVVTVPGAWIADLGGADAFRSYSEDEIARLGGRDAFVEAVWPGGSGEPVLGVPWTVTARLLYYRSDLFEELGIDPDEGLADWDAFEQTLETIAEATGSSAWGIPGSHDWNVVGTAMAWIWGAGGEVLDDAGHSQIASEETIRGVTKLHELVARHGHPGALAADDAEVQQQFVRGEYPITISGPWFAVTLRHDLRVGWAVAPLPAGPHDDVALIGGTHLAILEGTQHPEAALALVEFLADVPSQRRFAHQTGLLPGRVEAMQPGREREAVDHVLSNARTEPQVPGWVGTQLVLQRTFIGMWEQLLEQGPLDDAQIERLLQQADAEVREVLDAATLAP